MRNLLAPILAAKQFPYKCQQVLGFKYHKQWGCMPSQVFLYLCIDVFIVQMFCHCHDMGFSVVSTEYCDKVWQSGFCFIIVFF